jgi:hypothetical protein
MNADTFLSLARDDTMWLRKSVDLRATADVLWHAYQAEAACWARDQGADAISADAAWRRAMAHLDGAKMFYALALETGFKAIIVRDFPSELQFRTKTDAGGRLRSVQLTGSAYQGRPVTVCLHSPARRVCS